MNGAASRGANPVATALGILGLALAALSIWGGAAGSPGLFAAAALFILLAILGLSSVRMANQWEKAVVLRLGRLHAIRGPGLFVIVPVIDAVVSWVDQRIQTTEFTAEQALTKDTVPVNVDAIIFWQAHDAEKASLEIADYRQAIARVSQTSLREMIGSTPLTALLSERRKAD